MTMRFSATGRQASLDLELAPAGSAAAHSSCASATTAEAAPDDEGYGEGGAGLQPQTGTGWKNEDTSEVPCPALRDMALGRVGAAVATSNVGRALCALAILGVAGAQTFVGFRHGRKDSRELRVFEDVVLAIGTPIILISAMYSLGRVAGEAGELTLLGAGDVLVSSAAARSLRRAHAALIAPTSVFLLFALACVYSTTKVGTNSILTGNAITPVYLVMVVAWACGFVVVAVATIPFYLSLKIAAVIVADAVAEVKQAIERIGPVDLEWETEVVLLVRELCDKWLPLLSNGWGLGVGLNCLAWWLCALGMVAQFLFGRTVVSLVMVTLCTMIPLLMSYDVAAASSDCDRLHDVLNMKRKIAPTGEQAMAFEHAVRKVELILLNENTRQGLGFVVFGRVFDMKTLGNLMAVITSIALTVLPVLFSLSPEATPGAESEVVCLLDIDTRRTIQSSLRAMANIKKSCVYNFSTSPGGSLVDVFAGTV